MPISESRRDSSRILIGICGGVAAYKMGEVVSTLVQSGHQVTVAMSRNAKRFVGPATFRSLSAARSSSTRGSMQSLLSRLMSHWLVSRMSC